MKIEELRVGNLVYGIEFGSSNMVYTNTDPIVIDAECIGLTAHWGGDIYQPIPLTEEILLKCGFEAESKYDDFKLNGVKIRSWSMLSKALEGYNFYLNLGLANDELNNKVDSIHELQNLYYALTKEELDVNKLLK